MRILLESILIAILALPLGIPWIAIPYAILRTLVGAVENGVAEDIAVAPPGDGRTLIESLIAVGVVGVLAAAILYGLIMIGIGGTL